MIWITIYGKNTADLLGLLQLLSALDSISLILAPPLTHLSVGLGHSTLQLSLRLLLLFKLLPQEVTVMASWLHSMSKGILCLSKENCQQKREYFCETEYDAYNGRRIRSALHSPWPPLQHVSSTLQSVGWRPACLWWAERPELLSPPVDDQTHLKGIRIFISNISFSDQNALSLKGQLAQVLSTNQVDKIFCDELNIYRSLSTVLLSELQCHWSGERSHHSWP